MDEGLGLGDGDQFFILAVLHKDEPGRNAIGRSSVDGGLHCGVVARSVLCHYGIKHLGSGHGSFHHCEGDAACGEGIAAQVGDGILADVQGILLAIFQSVVCVCDALASKRAVESGTVQGYAARAGFDTLVEAEHDVAAG